MTLQTPFSFVYLDVMPRVLSRGLFLKRRCGLWMAQTFDLAEVGLLGHLTQSLVHDIPTGCTEK